MCERQSFLLEPFLSTYSLSSSLPGSKTSGHIRAIPWLDIFTPMLSCCCFVISVSRGRSCFKDEHNGILSVSISNILVSTVRQIEQKFDLDSMSVLHKIIYPSEKILLPKALDVFLWHEVFVDLFVMESSFYFPEENVTLRISLFAWTLHMRCSTRVNKHTVFGVK